MGGSGVVHAAHTRLHTLFLSAIGLTSSSRGAASCPLVEWSTTRTPLSTLWIRSVPPASLGCRQPPTPPSPVSRPPLLPSPLARMELAPSSQMMEVSTPLRSVSRDLLGSFVLLPYFRGIPCFDTRCPGGSWAARSVVHASPVRLAWLPPLPVVLLGTPSGPRVGQVLDNPHACLRCILRRWRMQGVQRPCSSIPPPPLVPTLPQLTFARAEPSTLADSRSLSFLMTTL